MYDITALGELLIDFTPTGLSHNGNISFESNPGGAPANVLAAAAKFNLKTAFIGKVGNDQFGHFLNTILIENNIDSKGLVYSDEINTTLAFVHLQENGDRSFSFYRKPGADMMLEQDEIDFTIVEDSRIFHFGSLSLTDEPSCSATFRALVHAKENNVMISYDPNLRIPLWNNLERAKEMMLKGLEYADIVKISVEELEFLTGITDLAKGSLILYEKYSLKLLFITLGSNGCFYRYDQGFEHVKGFTVNAIDTTGAGDAFLGGVLTKVLEKEKAISDFKKEDVEEIVLFANALAALSTTKKGAIPSLPSREEVTELLGGFNR